MSKYAVLTLLSQACALLCRSFGDARRQALVIHALPKRLLEALSCEPPGPGSWELRVERCVSVGAGVTDQATTWVGAAVDTDCPAQIYKVPAALRGAELS